MFPARGYPNPKVSRVSEDDIIVVVVERVE
jgi:hypothetical protein